MAATPVDIEASKRREEDYYRDLAPGYDELHKEEQVAKIRQIIAHLEIKKGAKLLDVGCGTGFSLGMWPTKHVTGAEPSHAMIRQALMKIQNKIIHVRAEDLSIFDNNEFDIVVSVTAIHNFTGIEDGLREMKRVGRKKFAFSVLKKSEKLGEIDKLIRKYFVVRDVIDENQHDRLYICSA